MDKGRIISSPADFPSVHVYERDEPSGKIYTIAFSNLESMTGWERFFVLFALLGTFFGLTLIGMNYHPGLGFIILFCGLPAMGIWAKESGPLRREKKRDIELDYGRNEFRVFVNDSLELERPLSQLKHITVDRHPDTDFERNNRQQKGEKGAGTFEKTHCLFGWFGKGGAEQVILVNRLEWPCHNSLREVREAIEWVRTDVVRTSAKDKNNDDGAWD